MEKEDRENKPKPENKQEPEQALVQDWHVGQKPEQDQNAEQKLTQNQIPDLEEELTEETTEEQEKAKSQEKPRIKGKRKKRRSRKSRRIRWRFGMLITVNMLIVAMLVWQLFRMDQTMTQINNQLTYLMDTNNIMQTNLGALQENIQATLEEEASLIADYSITPTDVDFEAGTYTVAVNITPKSFTDNTKTMIYFGTQEYTLEYRNNSFHGSMSLPLEETYDGNVTFLFVNGDQKSTEVLKNYVGFPHALENVISGKLSEFPTYVDGQLTIGGDISFGLQGNGVYEFSRVELIVTVDDQESYRVDLLTGTVVLNTTAVVDEDAQDNDGAAGDDNLAADSNQRDPAAPDDNGEQIPQGTEEDGVAVTDEGYISAMDGVYGMTEPLPIGQNAKIGIYLRAESKDGYMFQYQIFEGITAAVDAENPETQVDGWQDAEEYLPYIYTITDTYGGQRVKE